MLETLVIYGEQNPYFLLYVQYQIRIVFLPTVRTVTVRTVHSFDANGYLYVQAQYAQ